MARSPSEKWSATVINPTKYSSRHSHGLAAAALAGVLACAMASAAIAQPTAADSTQVSTAGGAQQLLHKIRMASVKVCASQGDDPYYATGGYFGCVRRTTADAVARANNPQLTALYRGGHGAVVLAKSR
jgi:hypothetical protein